MDFREYNILGSIINDSFGQSYEATPGNFKTVAKILGEDRFKITSMCVVNLLNRDNMHKAAKDAEDQLMKATNAYLKKIKSDFKKISGRALKTKKSDHDLSVELLTMSGYSGKGTALIRTVCNFSIS